MKECIRTRITKYKSENGEEKQISGGFTDLQFTTKREEHKYFCRQGPFLYQEETGGGGDRISE